MKSQIIFLLLFPMLALKAQDQNATIDSLAKVFTCDSCQNLEQFTKALVKPYTDKQERARAIFAWIGTHIRYDFALLESGGEKLSGYVRSQEDAERKIKEYKEVTMPNQTFKTKRGVCEHYSRLYKRMCDFAAVECVFISGNAKHISKRISNLGHAWNAIKLNDKWYLLDATWGSGYGENETFHRAYSPGFFMVEPQLFILNHLPDDDKWQLLDTPLSKQAFKKQPWLNYGQRLFAIEDAQPINKALVKEGNTVKIRIKFKQKPPIIMILSSDHKPIPHQESIENGYTIITLAPSDNDEILIYGGKTKTGRLMGLAKFYID